MSVDAGTNNSRQETLLSLSKNALVNKVIECEEQNKALKSGIQECFNYCKIAVADKAQMQIRLRQTHIFLIKEWNKMVKIKLPSDLELKILTDNQFQEFMQDMRNKYDEKISVWQSIKHDVC